MTRAPKRTVKEIAAIGNDPRPVVKAGGGATGRRRVGVIDHKGRALFGWSIRHGHLHDRAIVRVSFPAAKPGQLVRIYIDVRQDIVGKLWGELRGWGERSIDRVRIWRCSWGERDVPAWAICGAEVEHPSTAYVASAPQKLSDGRPAAARLRMAAKLWGISREVAARLGGRVYGVPAEPPAPSGDWRIDDAPGGRRLIVKVPDGLAPYVAAAPQFVRVRLPIVRKKGRGESIVGLKAIRGVWMPIEDVPPEALEVDFGGAAKHAHLTAKVRLGLARAKILRGQQEQPSHGVSADRTRKA